MSDAPGATGGWWSEWRRDTGNTAGTGVTNSRRDAKKPKRLSGGILSCLPSLTINAWRVGRLSEKTDENLVKPAKGKKPQVLKSARRGAPGSSHQSVTP